MLQLRHKVRKDELTWGLAAFTVDSPADLEAMRTALKDDIDYFESDLVGFTSIRALHDAAGRDNEYNIPNRALLETQETPVDTPKIVAATKTKAKPAANTPFLGSTCMDGGEVDWNCFQGKVRALENTGIGCNILATQHHGKPCALQTSS
jgi:hypothetical protein